MFLGLEKLNTGNGSLFLKDFISKKCSVIEKEGYKIGSGFVEYLVFLV